MAHVTNHHALYRLRAERVAYLLAGLPFLRMVGLNGSLARGTAKPESDIDFLIITKPGRMFTVRFLATILVQLLGVRRHGRQIAGRICLNRYQTTNQLDVLPHNQYHAEVFHLVIPLINIDQTYHQYLAANQWMIDFGQAPMEERHRRSRSYPLSRQLRLSLEWLLGGRFGNWLEQRFKNYQLAKIQRNPLTARYPNRVVITDDMLLFHVPGPGEIDHDLTQWDKAAAAYDALHGRFGDAYRRSVLDPVLIELLGNIRGKQILDAGCGNGYQTQWLVARGAQVIGIDGSSVMVARAKQNFPERDFRVVDLSQSLPFKNQIFDRILCSMVIHAVADPEPMLREFRRILKPSGFLVLALLHPAFAYPASRVSKNLLDRLFGCPGQIVIQSYHEPVVRRVALAGLHQPTTRYHRSLATYQQWFRTTGWKIIDLCEPVNHEDKGPTRHIPLTLVCKLEPTTPNPKPGS